MRVFLYYTWFNWEYVNAGIYDYLIKHNDISEITIVTCEGINLPCHANYQSERLKCNLCKLNKALFFKSLEIAKPNLKINHLYIENISVQFTNEHEKIITDFKNSKDSVYDFLTKLKYKGCNIGFGIMSTYISNSRNYKPEKNADSMRFFLQQISQQLVLVDSFLQYFNKSKFEKYLLFNGRSNDTRFLFDILKNTKQNETFIIENIIVKENKYNIIESMAVEILPCRLPQDIEYRHQQIISLWLKSDEQFRISEGEKYFQERIENLNAKDHKDLFIENWVGNETNVFNDGSKIKVVIFNSSSDETASIPEVNKFNYFGDQNKKIKQICLQLSKDPKFEVVLRIHPNLKNISYNYHKELYELSKLVKVIEADSSVNSYGLIKSADLIIVFGSTIGVEACYLNKPVINLGAALYSFLDVSYNPKSDDELNDLLNSALTLPPKPRLNSLKYGFFMKRRDLSALEPFTNKIYLNKWVKYNYQNNYLNFLIKKNITSSIGKVSNFFTQKNKNIVPFKEVLT